jgi:hypothetical protein
MFTGSKNSAEIEEFFFKIKAFFQRADYDDPDKLLYAISKFSGALLIWLQNWQTMN